MAINNTRITGSVVLPSGTPPVGGRIKCRLSLIGTVADGAAHQVILGQQVFTIGSDGTVDFTLVPNSEITPAGSCYVLEFDVPGCETFIEKVTVPTSPDPCGIGDLTRVA